MIMKKPLFLAIIISFGLQFSYAQGIKSSANVTNDNYVSLIDFSYMVADYKHGRVEIIWETDKEINIKYFTIERTIDGGALRDIGFVNGQRYSKRNKKYIFYDKSLQEGTAFYRLKIRDFSGNVSYTEWVLLK